MKQTQTSFYDSLGRRFYLFESLHLAQQAAKYNDDNHREWPIAYFFHEGQNSYGTTEFWNDVTKSLVVLTEPDGIILAIEKYGQFWHVLVGEKVGWIIMDGYDAIKELTNEK